MKIYFCEKCGASVPLQEVVGGRAKATDGKVYCAQHMPGTAEGDLELYFCDVCGVSIPLQEVITGHAVTEGDRTTCASCSRQAAKKDSSGDRFRLYFCDSCNTSVPQSHVVTGRALTRGGKTYCEACRDRATKKLSPVVPVVGIVILAVIILALVLEFAPGPRDDGPPSPDPVALLSELESTLGTRLEGIDADNRAVRDDLADAGRELSVASETFARELGKLEEKVVALETLAAERAGSAAKIAALEAEVARLKPLEDRVNRLAGLEAEVERLRSLLAAAPRAEAAPAPEPGPRAEPAPLPAADVPAAVKEQIALLDNPDSGKRFSAAVELGKLAHAGAVEALSTALLKDEDYFVRRAAARALGKVNVMEAVPALIEALMDDEIFVSLQAAKSLRSITGKEFGFDENLSESQRRRVQGKWKKWWKDQEK